MERHSTQNDWHNCGATPHGSLLRFTFFRRSLLDNLNYGNGSDSTGRVGLAIQGTDLLSVLERLPDGLQTELGESGALVSGGEGQNVRIGRAMARPDVRLAILDEPARGLDREARRSLLARSRRHFAKATMIFVTHDVPDTLDFQRVLVVEQGRIIEQGFAARVCMRRQIPGTALYAIRRRSLASGYGQDRLGGT